MPNLDYIDADYWTCPFCQRWLPPYESHECEEYNEFEREMEVKNA